MELSIGVKRRTSDKARKKRSGVRNLRVCKLFLDAESARILRELSEAYGMSLSGVVRQLLAEKNIKINNLFKID